MKKVLAEALLVAVLGATLGFAANGLSPRGLKLARDYFPGAHRPSIPISETARIDGTNTTLHNPTPAEAALARLKQKGLQVVDEEQVLTLFHDPRYEQGLIVFVDARNDEHYQQSHIPGAYQLDRTYPERYLGPVLLACNPAQQIVVYCSGGDCELSEFAAALLHDAGIPYETIFIFANGLPAWQARGLPIESGDRKSGQISTATK